MRPPGRLLLAWGMAAALACGGCDQRAVVTLNRQLIDARDQLRQAEQQTLVLREQLAQRDRQIQTLQALGDAKRMAKLFTVQRVRIGSYTAGVNTDGRPGDDAVRVFVEPVDQYGSTIKAAGDVTVQLFDLAAPPQQNLLTTRRWSVDQVHADWTSGFMTQYYIFEVPLKGLRVMHEELTVRVEFVDYLTGRSFSDQKAVKVSLAPPASQPASRPASGPASAAGPAGSAPASAPATSQSAPVPSTAKAGR